MRYLDEMDMVLQEVELLKEQNKEAEVLKLHMEIVKSYVLNAALVLSSAELPLPEPAFRGG